MAHTQAFAPRPLDQVLAPNRRCLENEEIKYGIDPLRGRDVAGRWEQQMRGRMEIPGDNEAEPEWLKIWFRWKVAAKRPDQIIIPSTLDSI